MNSQFIILAAVVALLGCTPKEKVKAPEVTKYEAIKGSILRNGEYFDNHAGFGEFVAEIQLSSNGDAILVVRTDTLGREEIKAKWSRIGSSLTLSSIESKSYSRKNITLPYEEVECGIKQNTNNTRYIFDGFRVLTSEGNFLRGQDSAESDLSYYLYYAKNKKLEPAGIVNDETAPPRD